MRGPRAGGVSRTYLPLLGVEEQHQGAIPILRVVCQPWRLVAALCALAELTDMLLVVDIPDRVVQFLGRGEAENEICSERDRGRKLHRQSQDWHGSSPAAEGAVNTPWA